MEFLLIFGVTIVAFFVWQYISFKRDMKIKAALSDFMDRIVVCKVEQCEGEYYLYHEITKQFLAQGKTAKDVLNNLPKNDGKFYMSQDGERDIKQELEDLECMRLKST